MNAKTISKAREVVLSLTCTLSGVTATTPDGRKIPLDACSWVEIAPCGCMSAITLAVHGTDVLASVEMARAQLSDGKRDAAEQNRLGFTLHLIEHAQYGEHLLPLFKGTCQHDPQWGYARKTKNSHGITFTRIREREWTADRESGWWRLEKQSSTSWYLWPPGKVRDTAPHNRAVTYAGRNLTEALTTAGATIKVHEDGGAWHDWNAVRAVSHPDRASA